MEETLADKVAVGAGRETPTVTDLITDFEALEQLKSYVVVCVGETVAEPKVAPPVEKLVPAHEVAFAEDQVRVELCPWVIEPGLA